MELNRSNLIVFVGWGGGGGGGGEHLFSLKTLLVYRLSILLNDLGIYVILFLCLIW